MPEPKDEDTLSNRCAELLKKGDVDEAVEAFSKMMSPKSKKILHGDDRFSRFNNGFSSDGTPLPLED